MIQSVHWRGHRRHVVAGAVGEGASCNHEPAPALNGDLLYLLFSETISACALAEIETAPALCRVALGSASQTDCRVGIGTEPRV